MIAEEEAGLKHERKVELAQRLAEEREERERKFNVKMAGIDRKHKEVVAERHTVKGQKTEEFMLFMATQQMQQIFQDWEKSLSISYR